MADLYNWRRENTRFSDNPKELIGLVDTNSFTISPLGVIVSNSCGFFSQQRKRNISFSRPGSFQALMALQLRIKSILMRGFPSGDKLGIIIQG